MVLPVATPTAAASEPPGLRQIGAEVRPVELVPSRPSRPAPLTAVQPLTSEARRLHVTVSKRFLEKLEVAREALSHSHPNADAEAILEAGLDLLIERAAKRKGPSPRGGCAVLTHSFPVVARFARSRRPAAGARRASDTCASDRCGLVTVGQQHLGRGQGRQNAGPSVT